MGRGEYRRHCLSERRYSEPTQGQYPCHILQHSRAYCTNSSVLLQPPIYCTVLICVTRFLLNALGKDLCHIDSKVSPLGDRAERLALKFLREERGVNHGICYPPIPLKA